MILYRLACDCGHEFETWFQSGRAFDVLAAGGELTCPLCGASNVRKALMAPRIAKGGGTPEPPSGAEISRPDDTNIQIASGNPELVAAVRRLRQEVKEKADYVGPKFADEARKIDAGDAPDRGIYGEATASEARALLDDGIAILPLPRLPEENN